MSSEHDIRIPFDEIKKETDGAYLLDMGDEEMWFPKSQVRIYEKKKVVYVPMWMAKDKGLL